MEVNLPVSVHIECVLWFVGKSRGERDGGRVGGGSQASMNSNIQSVWVFSS